MAVKASTIITLIRVDDGATGTGVESMIPEFYLSTSKTTQTGGSWVTTPPAWSTGKYMWRRDKIVYKNPTSAFYTAAVCDSSWEAVNEIEVGGRNLLHRYMRSGLNSSNVDNGTVKIGVSTVPLDTYFYLKPTMALTTEETYTISCEASNVPDGCNWSFGVALQSSQFQLYISKNGKCSATGKIHTGISQGDEILIDDYANRPNTAVNIILTNFKLEKGNKATDWTPAPEDIQDQIDSTVSQLNDLASDSKLTPNEKTTTKKEWLIIADECPKYITQANAYGVSTSAYTAAYNTLNSYLNTTNSGVIFNMTTTTDISSTTFTNNFKTYYNCKVELTNAINTAKAKHEADSVEVGGKNLILDSGKEHSVTTSYDISRYSLSEPLVLGETYVFTIWADLSSDRQWIGLWGDGGNWNPFGTINRNSSGVYKSQPVTLGYLPNNKTDNFQIYSGPSESIAATSSVTVRKIKLEKGNKATDWTPAPEDIQDQITTITETVAGASRKTDDVANKITDKIWQKDVDTSVNQYDQTVGKSIRDRETKTESDINVIKSTISDVQTTISTKANKDVVEAISTRLNETVNTVSSFQRTIYESYVTKDSMQIMQSSIEQLSTSIASKISASDAQSLINQNKNYWRADFEENGVLCGTTQIDKTGITVGSGNSSYTTKITPTEFAGYYNNVKVFYLNQDETVSERLRVKKGIDLTNLKIVPALQNGIKGIDFLSSGALLL